MSVVASKSLVRIFILCVQVATSASQGTWTEWSLGISCNETNQCGHQYVYKSRGCPSGSGYAWCYGEYLMTLMKRTELMYCRYQACSPERTECLKDGSCSADPWKCLALGSCVERCQSHSLCPSNQRCDFLSGVCRRKCSEDQDCGSTGYLCLGGVCLTSCTSDQECTSTVYNKCSTDGYCTVNIVDGQPDERKHRDYCSQLFGADAAVYDGVCMKRCQTSEDCSAGIPCNNQVKLCSKAVSFTCTGVGDECGGSSELQCDSSQGSCILSSSTDSIHCTQNTCAYIQYDIESLKTCIQTSECEGYLEGYKTVCSRGNCVCLRLYQGQCQDKTISSDCTTDEHCQLFHHSLSVCVNGLCACPSQHKLMNTYCVDVSSMIECWSNKDCPNDHLCLDTQCIQSCLTNGDCSDGLVCSNGACSLPCTHSSQCIVGQICMRDGGCAQLCHSESGYNDVNCDDVKQLCFSSICINRCGTCGSQQVCLAGLCMNLCHRDSDCMSWEACIGGTCKPPCSSSHSCPDGFTCTHGYCYKTCKTDQECLGTLGVFTCYAGLLVPGAIGGTDGICIPFYQKPHMKSGMLSLELISSCQALTTTGSGAWCGMACQNHDDCGSMFATCLFGQCLYNCTSNSDCYTQDCQMIDTNICLRNSMIATCDSTADCNFGFLCKEGACKLVYGRVCNATLDCEYDNPNLRYYCDTYKAVCLLDNRVGLSCGSYMTCGSGEFCSDGVCRCIRDIHGKCRGSFRPLAIIEELDITEQVSVCGYLRIKGLVYNQTRRVCECPSNSLIKGSRCVTLSDGITAELRNVLFKDCLLDNDCSDITICLSGKCRLPCRNTCPIGLVCSHSVCTTECQRHDECDYGEVCSPRQTCDVSCDVYPTTDNQCGYNQKCVDGLCVEYYWPPTSEADCFDGEVFIPSEKFCSPMCTRDEECRGGACVGGVCGAHCFPLSYTCPAGRTCLGGLCLFSCPCPEDMVCIDNACHQKCQISHDCFGSFTCVSGTCLPRCSHHNHCPDHMGCSHGICTHICQQDSDCPGSHANYTCTGAEYCEIKCSTQSQCASHQSCVLSKYWNIDMCEQKPSSSCTTDSCPKGFYCHTTSSTCIIQLLRDLPCNSREDCGLNDICIINKCQIRPAFDGKPMVGLLSSTSYQDPTGLFTTCEVDKQCKPGMVCVSFRCYAMCTTQINKSYLKCSKGIQVSKCSADADCDSHQMCVNHFCAVRCPYCASNQGCYGDTLCLQNDKMACDSPTELYVNGICKEKCNSDRECPHGACVYGVCDMTCSASRLCPHGTTCVQGRCITECFTDSSCASNQKCFNGLCTTPCQTGQESCASLDRLLTCDYQSDCGDSNLVCTYGICTQANYQGGTGCANGWQKSPSVSGCLLPCSDDLQCMDGFYCNPQGFCQTKVLTICSKQADCLSDSLYCDGGLCKRLKRRTLSCTIPDRPCGLYEDCVDGYCTCSTNGADSCITEYFTTCNSDLDCSSSFYCDLKQRRCLCPDEYELVGVNCMKRPQLPSNTNFNLLTKCSSDGDCPKDSVCQSYNCYPVCASSDSCQQYSNKLTCYQAVCSLKCMVDADCDSNQYCWQFSTPGTCVTRCFSDMDCPSLQSCSNGACTGYCTTHEDCHDGMKCHQNKCLITGDIDSDCTYGRSSEGFCSPLCSVDADCSPGQTCQKRKCINACTSDSVLPEGHICLMGLSVKPCKPSASGEPCGDHCWSHADCGTGLVCIQGTCTISCLEDYDCPESFVCAEDMFGDAGCVYQCKTSDDCNAYQHCSTSKVCEALEGKQCKQDSDCGSGTFYCEFYSCKSRVKEHAGCYRSEDCGPNEVCEAGYCVCVTDQNGDCLGPPPACPGSVPCSTIILDSVCNTDHNWCECGSGEEQVGNRCIDSTERICSISDPCPNGEECINYHCYAICHSNQCPSGYICSNGLCMANCTADNECSSSQICRCGTCMLACEASSHCSINQLCYKGLCREICSSTGISCHDFYTCMNGICVHNCTEPECEGSSEQCDCDKKITDDRCVSYEVKCPPHSGDSAGYIHKSADQASSCADMILSSECETDSGLCVCPAGLVRYGGGFCQTDIRGCDETFHCPEVSQQCISGYCLPSCGSGAGACDAEFTCSSVTCMLKCSSNITCVPPADCDAGVCSSPRSGDFDCLADQTCNDTFATCDVETGRCECTVGTYYSEKRYRCEWVVDQACMNCPPCVTSCPSDNMICNRDLRTCVCKNGYKLSPSGTKCISKQEEITTTIDCSSINDCNQLPNSICSSTFSNGHCQCRSGYCYRERQCQPDIDECRDYECPEGLVCANLQCNSGSPLCVAEHWLRMERYFNHTCTSTSQCLKFKDLTYCYAGFCTCVLGALVKDGRCQEGLVCQSDIDCLSGKVCRSLVCVDAPLLYTETKQKNKSKFTIVWIVLGLILFIALWALLIVAARRQHEKIKEEEKKMEMVAKATESRVSMRRSSVADRRISLERKISEAQNPKEADDHDTKSLPAAAHIEEVKKDAEPSPSKGSVKMKKSTRVKFQKSAHGSVSKKSIHTVKETSTSPQLVPTQSTDAAVVSSKKSKSHHNQNVKVKSSKSNKGSLASSASKPRIKKDLSLKSKLSTTGKITD